MQFYAFRHDENKLYKQFTLFWRIVCNQYSVDKVAKMISERFDFIRRNQKNIPTTIRTHGTPVRQTD